jgi:hypothetical protein
MPAKRYEVKDVVLESPLYGGQGGMTGVAARGVSGEDDILGHGWAAIEDNSITIAVQPRGVVAMLGPKEKRTYVLADIASWDVNGPSIAFGVGSQGLFATNGAEAPNHICQMECENADAARQLTEQARVVGLRTGSGPAFHSGI